MRRFRLELDPERPDAVRVLQLALDRLPAVDPEPPWQRVLYVLANDLGEYDLGAVDDAERQAIERFGEGVDGWRDEAGRPLLRFTELR